MGTRQGKADRAVISSDADDVRQGDNTPFYIDTSNVTNGYLLAATANSATFQAPGVSSFSDVIVVDGDGNGDHTTLAAAVAAASSGDTIRVVSRTTESGNISLTTTVVIEVIASGYVDMGSNLITANGTVTISGSGFIRADRAGSVIDVAGGSLLINGPITVLNENASGIAVELSAVASSFTLLYCIIDGGTIGLDVNALPTLAFIGWSRFIGSTNAVDAAGAPWASAPFYHCLFDGGTANVTADAGTANGSNIEI